MGDDFGRYEAARDAGSDALASYLAAVAEGLDTFARIRMLRAVYGLSLTEAKDVAIRGETGDDLATHQGRLAAGLSKVQSTDDE